MRASGTLRQPWRSRHPASGIELHENLVALDHPEFVARAFLDCEGSVAKIGRFRFETFVAHALACVDLLLKGKLPIEFPHAQPAAVAHPQRVLDQREQAGQDHGEQSHGGSAADAVKRVAAGILRRIAEILFNPQQLVVFGDPVAAGNGSGLDLQGVGSHGDVRDRGVFGLA